MCKQSAVGQLTSKNESQTNVSLYQIYLPNTGNMLKTIDYGAIQEK